MAAGESFVSKPRARRREAGSVVTYAVAIFMLAALLFYLVVAFFAEEPKELENELVEPTLAEEPAAP